MLKACDLMEIIPATARLLVKTFCSMNAHLQSVPGDDNGGALAIAAPEWTQTSVRSARNLCAIYIRNSQFAPRDLILK